MPPKQYQRPKNPPRFHSSDAVPQHRSSSPAPPLPHSNLAPTDYSSDRETGGSVGRRSPSPSISSGSSAHRATRKPVPVYNPTDEPPVPAGAPKPNNPNPFAAANALVALRSNEAAASAPTSRPLTPGAGEHRGRTTAHGHDEEDKVSPTSKAHNRRSTSPDGSPDDDDEIATLNFARRPSQFDPLAPSFHPSHGQTSGGQQGARSLLPAGGRQPSQQKGQHQRQRSSHTRHPSISLGVGAGSGSPSSSPLPSPSFNPSFGAQQSAPPAGQDGRKILPLQPAARSGGPHSKNAHSDQRVEGTRAPIEAFASVEMLQGMRQASERSRGTEVFGPGGTYEGRASSISGEAGLPAYSRRTADPLASLHAARNPFAQAQHDHRSGGGAPQLPPIHVGGANAEADVFSIANQLRAHDQLRRGSEDVNSLGYQRRFSSNEEDDLSPPPSAGGVTKLNPHFSFPAMKGGNSSSVSLASSTGGNTGGKTPAPAYPDSMGGLASAFDDDDEGSTRNSRNSHRYPPDLKSFFTFGGSSNNKDSTGGGWRTENLGTSAAGQLSSQSSSSAFAQPRPSIVALPVYPSPGGSVSRSFKTRTKKIATRVCILTGLATIAATWFYLWLRYHAMRTVEGKRPGIFVGGWAFLSLETVVAAMTSIHILWTTLTYRARTADPKMRLRGDANLPSVDVFIVASGQADQTVFDCAVAAASIDYPPHRYRVMVLDAGASDNLQKELARHAKAQACPHLSYHRRELGATGNRGEGEKSPKLTVQQRKTQKEDRVSNKANSINFGMMEASSFGIKGPAEYVAVFDADMIPERNYLRAVLPHILTSPKTALVKTRHGFINLPHRLSQAASTLYTAAETPSDTRSGFLLRRAALSDIGGFPADSWIHDGQCEALLLGRGFKVHQVDEVLQWGMAKPTYAAQVNAMMVNRLGPLRTAHRLGWFLGGEKTKLMPFAARAKAVGKALLPIFSVVIIVLAYVYPFMFSFGGILVLTPNLSNLNHLLQATLLMLLLSKLHESLWCWSTGQPSPRRSMQSWIFAAPYQGLALVRLMLPVKLGGFKRGTDLDINEVIAHPEREVWYKRTLRFALDPNVGTMFGFLAALGVAIWRIVKEYEHGTVDEHQTALTVLLTVAWPSLLWLEFVMAAFVPFVCLLFPSRLLTEPRESFLIRDHYSSVARPKHHFKTASPFKVHRAPEFVTGTFVLAWAIVCVCVAKLTDVLA